MDSFGSRVLQIFLKWSPIKWFMLKILPHLRFSVGYTRYKGVNFVIASRIMSPGQFICSYDEAKAATAIVPGITSHAAYVVNNCFYSGNTDNEIVELTSKNFTKSYLFDTCKESSRILICECVDWDLEHKRKMIELSNNFESVKYDTSFELGVESLYCSELIYHLDKMAGAKLDVDLSDFAGIGQKYISPDGLLFGKNVRIVWDSDSELTGLMGPEAEAYCKNKGYIK